VIGAETTTTASAAALFFADSLSQSTKRRLRSRAASLLISLLCSFFFVLSLFVVFGQKRKRVFFLFFLGVQNPKMWDFANELDKREREHRERCFSGESDPSRQDEFEREREISIYPSLNISGNSPPQFFSISNSRVTYIYLLLPPRAFLRRNEKDHAHVIRII